MKKFLHQSYIFVGFCLGVMVGMILMAIFDWKFFASPIWVIFAILLFVFAYFRPTYAFLVAAFIGGMIIAAVRATNFTESFLESSEFILMVRDWFAERICGVVEEPEAQLGVSYLLGMKSNLPAMLDENLKAVGLAHIVVASGAHLSILVDVARKIFGKVSRLFGLCFSLLFIMFFMSMVGWTPSILRAGIMAILTLLAWYSGRKFAAWRIILIVMTITLLIDPTFLTNVGWLLSFASYAGIMILGPAITRHFFGKKKPGFLASSIITTISATLLTMPIVLYYFGSISLISVVANLLILPTLPYAMLLTFLAGVFAEVPWLGVGIGWLATKLLQFHIAVIEFFGAQTYFIISVPRYNTLIFLLYIPILLPFCWGKIRQCYKKVVKLREVSYKN